MLRPTLREVLTGIGWFIVLYVALCLVLLAAGCPWPGGPAFLTRVFQR